MVLKPVSFNRYSDLVGLFLALLMLLALVIRSHVGEPVQLPLGDRAGIPAAQSQSA